LISFPTLALLIYGRDGVAYAHDVFDVVRTGVVGDWLTYGPTLWGNGITSGNALLGPSTCRWPCCSGRLRHSWSTRGS
jgi:hypothetical protein